MTGQGVRWTAEQVLALAPDSSSRQAGSKLSSATRWAQAGTGDGAVWGLCKGSGSTPYQTAVDLRGGNGLGYRCSCPSRKFPCKHAIGLLLLWADGEAAVVAEPEPPEWAGEWLSSRRQPAADPQQRAAGGAGESGGGKPPSDPRAARRRAEKRAARIAAGASELERRLADMLRGGLAGAGSAGYAEWEEMAARMVDAQAPGLASRLRGLSAHALGARWPERLLEECALLHLLNQGYLRVAELPEPLAATVRARVGLTVDTSELLADPAARQRDHWLVLAQRDEEDGRLTARRVWLLGLGSRRPALLLSYGAAGRTPELALPVGHTLDADLAFYPGASQLRAALGERHAAPAAGCVPEGGTLRAALAAYATALSEDPWLEAWPVVLSGVLPLPPSGEEGDDAGWQLAQPHHTGGWYASPAHPSRSRSASDGAEARAAPAGAERRAAGAGGGATARGAEVSAGSPAQLGPSGGLAVPVTPGISEGSLWKLTALAEGRPVTVFGEYGHRGFAPYTAWTEEGVTVPL